MKLLDVLDVADRIWRRAFEEIVLKDLEEQRQKLSQLQKEVMTDG
jgi:cell division FtsZ-interacting protein ZapD